MNLWRYTMLPDTPRPRGAGAAITDALRAQATTDAVRIHVEHFAEHATVDQKAAMLMIHAHNWPTLRDRLLRGVPT